MGLNQPGPAVDNTDVTPDDLFDTAVVDGVRSGDPDALAAVYRALVQPLTAWLRSQVRQPQLADDIAQETFVELVRDCAKIRGGPLELRTWVFRAAHNNLVDRARARQRRPESPLDKAPDDLGPSDDPLDRVLEDELATTLQDALDELTDTQRQVVTLRFLAGISAPEVAAVVDRTEGAVRALQHRGVARLASTLRSVDQPGSGVRASLRVGP